MEKEFRGQSYSSFGGTSGMGFEPARRILEGGGTIVIVGRNVEKNRGPKRRPPRSAGWKRSTLRAGVQAGIDSGEAEGDVIGRILARVILLQTLA
jgi:NAD(P)-dependent dehydrogenase (short-subunit alcohol dehydrogenase family)